MFDLLSNSFLSWLGIFVEKYFDLSLSSETRHQLYRLNHQIRFSYHINIDSSSHWDLVPRSKRCRKVTTCKHLFLSVLSSVKQYYTGPICYRVSSEFPWTRLSSLSSLIIKEFSGWLGPSQERIIGSDSESGATLLLLYLRPPCVYLIMSSDWYRLTLSD